MGPWPPTYTGELDQKRGRGLIWVANLPPQQPSLLSRPKGGCVDSGSLRHWDSGMVQSARSPGPGTGFFVNPTPNALQVQERLLAGILERAPSNG